METSHRHPAFTLSLPDARAAIPLVCDSPHSGTNYPANFGHATEQASLRLSEDTHVEHLWNKVPQVGGALLAAHFPRSYIDANRAETDIDVDMLESGEWSLPAAPSKLTMTMGNGLIWRNTPDNCPIYQRKLTGSEVMQRIEDYWRPYRDALADQLEDAHARHGAYWHLNLHSMPSNAYERLGLPGKPTADIVLGDLYGTSCDPEFRAVVAAAFRASGCTVAINDPYEGAELVRFCGKPSDGRHSLQVEVNRALYMVESTREPHQGFAPLQISITQVLESVAAYVKHRMQAAPPHA